MLIDLLSCYVWLVAALLPLGDLSDALLDDLCCGESDVLSVISEGLEYIRVVVFLAKQLVEGDDLLFAAELAQDEHCRVLFDVCRAGISIILKPVDGVLQALIDDSLGDGTTSLG